MAGKVVFAILPKAGLGNKLYVWAKATVFAEVNHADVVTWGWVQPSLGPFLRGERSKRLYIRQFRQSEISDLFVLIKKTWLKDQIIDPPLIKVSDDIFENTTYCFKGLKKGIPDDSFGELKLFRAYIKVQLQRILSADVEKALAKAESPVVGIHVRRGDFAFTPWLTPLEYFQKRVSQIREASGKCLPVTIFSDGSDNELAPLLDMPRVKRASTNPEIVDILLLSRSQVLVTCPASTFSNWAAFLSGGVIIRDYLFPHKPARPQEVNKTSFEGIPGEDTSDWPALLLENLARIEYP